MTKDDVIKILYTKINNMSVAKYNCENVEKKCCQSKNKNSRLDMYCKLLPLNRCDRSTIRSSRDDLTNLTEHKVFSSRCVIKRC